MSLEGPSRPLKEGSSVLAELHFHLPTIIWGDRSARCAGFMGLRFFHSSYRGSMDA